MIRRVFAPPLSLLTLQDYSRTSIPGVQLIELARHVDESGSFTELMRISEDGLLLDPRGLPLQINPPDVTREGGPKPELFKPRQFNWSELEPGIVRAFHVHKRQTDVWFVPAHEKVLVLLADLRGWLPAPTFENPVPEIPGGDNGKPIITQHQRVVLGDGRSRLLVIPPMVAHGFRSLLDHKTRLLYAVNTHFDPSPERCDEWRLPWDLFGEEIWDIKNG